MKGRSLKTGIHGRPLPPGHRMGRPKGSKNKVTLEIQAAARNLIEAPGYLRSLQLRLRRGTAPHMETLLFHYAYGPPKTTVDIPQLGDIAALLKAKVVHELHPGPTRADLLPVVPIAALPMAAGK